jgi:hypothetical protein
MRHAVALVPGFLGFDHVGAWTYWADRFLAGLRAHLEAQRGGPIAVVPVPAPPLGSLAERQRALRRSLKALDDTSLDGPYRWHLVGHSTGGVDAAMLARTDALADGSDGSIFSEQQLLPRFDLASITTIAAPHYGTCLALAPIAELRRGHYSTTGLVELAAAAVAVAARGDDQLSTRIKFAIGSALEGSTAKFLYDLLANDRLARDLRPSVCATLTSTPNRRTDVPIFCIATMAPPPTPDLPDRLFRDLWTFTQIEALQAQPRPPAVAWRSMPSIVAVTQAIPSTIGPRDNDGVVSTDRQVDCDGPNASFAGLVLADHGDVIGLYRRTDPLAADPDNPRKGVIEPGLLTSGSKFGDDEFFRLLALVAKGILSRMPP